MLTDSSVSRYLEYTHIGAKDDATSLDNLLKALDMIDECNRLREGEGLEPLKVSETALAMAMVQANFAANGNYFHNRQYDNAGENLDWNGEDARTPTTTGTPRKRRPIRTRSSPASIRGLRT